MLHPEELQQAERVCASRILRGKDSLCRLLRFLIERSDQDRPPTESDIASAVFGRKGDFDPQLDSSVRVALVRLRAGLADYYKELGREDSIIIEVPRGLHPVRFSSRNRPDGNHTGQEMIDAAKPRPSRSRFVFWFVGVCFGPLVAIFAYAAIAGDFRTRAGVPPSVRLFWAPFIESSAPTLGIFGNTRFFENGGTLVRLPPKNSPALRTNESVTGVGEVVAAVELSRVFSILAIV
jgi:hypothetical protein